MPARQVAPALLSVVQKSDGTAQISVRLHPADLGAVNVRIERPTEHTAQVVITAEKPETLQMLKTDQAELHRVLDHAGLPPEGRTIPFHAAPSPTPEPGGDNAGIDSHAGGPNGQGQTGRGSPRRQPATVTAIQDDGPVPPQWSSVGLDITA